MRRDVCFAAALLLAGCAAMQAERNAQLDARMASGAYRAAALLAEQRLGMPSPKSDGALPPVPQDGAQVLDHLEAAQAWRLAGDPARSADHFDAAEAALKRVELESGLVEGGRQAAAVLFNDTALDYLPSPAEAVLINYYKALDFLALARPADARVELNRAEERIRRAVDRYSAEITAAQTQASRNGRAGAGYGDASVRAGVAANFPEMSQWRTYRDFVVPPATYLHALFLGRSADPADQSAAAALYARLAEISDGNSAVLADAREARAGRVCPHDDCIWILAEQGVGPERVERRFSLPVFTYAGPLNIELALPALVSRDTGLTPLRAVTPDGSQGVPELASMDRVMQTEFSKRFPAVVTRAVISSAAKAVTQYQVDRKNGPWAGVLAGIVTIATTGADLRAWRSVPGRFALLRLTRAQARGLRLEGARGPIEVQLPPSGAALVHLSQPGDVPVLEILTI